MIVSAFTFTIFTILAKALSADYNPGYLAFWRAFIALIMSIPFLMTDGLGLLKTNRPGLIMVRSIFGSVGFLLSVYAVSEAYGLPLSQFNAISFSRSLFVTVLAALVLREVIGVHRWGAVGVGFLGVLIMTLSTPGADGAGTSTGVSMALGSSIALAAAIILVKSLAATHRPITLLIWANILSTVFLTPFAILYWVTPSLTDAALILVMSAMAFGGQYCYIKAMSVGEASFLSSLDYLRLPMATVADWMLFRLLPGLQVWIGAVVIVLSTLYIALREARLRVRGRNTKPPL